MHILDGHFGLDATHRRNDSKRNQHFTSQAKRGLVSESSRETDAPAFACLTCLAGHGVAGLGLVVPGASGIREHLKQVLTTFLIVSDGRRADGLSLQDQGFALPPKLRVRPEIDGSRHLIGVTGYTICALPIPTSRLGAYPVDRSHFRSRFDASQFKVAHYDGAIQHIRDQKLKCTNRTTEAVVGDRIVVLSPPVERYGVSIVQSHFRARAKEPPGRRQGYRI